MNPYLSMPVIVFGGLDNSLYEHAAVVTFVHRSHASTLAGQLGTVNVRVFLDSHIADRVLKFVPVVKSREEAIELNGRGAGYIAYPALPDEPEVIPQHEDPSTIPPAAAFAAFMHDVFPPRANPVQVS